MKLGEAVGYFLASLTSGEREAGRQVIHRFARWFGWQRPLAGLTAPEIAKYAQRVSSSDPDQVKKLDLVRAFLAQAKKEGWTKSNLAVHFRGKKRKVKAASWSRQATPKTVPLTQPGYAQMKQDLKALKNRRLQTIDEIRRAAADKDFRENAPLAAAKEELSYIEGRIRGLEETLKSAVLIDNQPRVAPVISIGDSISLLDLASGKELYYTVVSPKEVDPLKDRISSASPIGKAIIGRAEGDIIEITAPAGRLRYKIGQVGHKQA